MIMDIYLLFTTATMDYLNTSVLLTFPPSLELSQTLCENITIVDDSVLENDEDFVVSLSSADSSVITGSEAIVSILNDDG